MPFRASEGSLAAALGARTKEDDQRQQAVLTAVLGTLPPNDPRRAEMEARFDELTGISGAGSAIMPEVAQPPQPQAFTLGRGEVRFEQVPGQAAREIARGLPPAPAAGARASPQERTRRRLVDLRLAREQATTRGEELEPRDRIELEVLERGDTEFERLNQDVLKLRRKAQQKGLTAGESEELNLKERRANSLINFMNALMAPELSMSGGVAPMQAPIAPTAQLSPAQQTAVSQAQVAIQAGAPPTEVRRMLQEQFNLNEEQIRAAGF